MNIDLRDKLVMLLKYSFKGFIIQCLLFNTLWASDKNPQEARNPEEVRISLNDVVQNEDDTNISELEIISQGITITGKVISDEDPDGLPGVNIMVKGTSLGTVTDVMGNYSLEVPGAESILAFSSVGFVSEEITVGTNSIVDMVLIADIKSLSEIVVIGYGTVKKETLIGSISTASGAELQKSPQPNLSNSFAGRISGLITNTPSGEPGFDKSRLLIRGASTNGDNSPLIVIDGVAGRPGGLDRLDPNDVESVSVLKDASAAIYGARAANGVIIVTTNRGVVGKPVLNFSYNHGFVKPTRLPGMADSPTYALTQNEIAYYNNPNGGFFQAYSESDIQKFADGSDPLNYANTDWLDEVIRPVSNQNQLSLSINGGTETAQYFISLGRRTQEGIYKNGALDFEQWNLRSNVDVNITDHFKIGFDISAREEDITYPTEGASSIFRFTYRAYPTEPAYYPGVGPSPGVEDGKNPILIGTDIPGTDDQTRYYVNSLINFDWNLPFAEYLTVKGFLAIDRNFLKRKQFDQPWTVYRIDNSTDPPSFDEEQRGPVSPELYQYQENGDLNTAHISLNFAKQYGDNNVTAFVAYEQSASDRYWFDATRLGFASPAVPEIDQGGSLSSDSRNSGNSYRETRQNVFGRVSYGYKEKYLAELQFRYDGSSIFPEGERFGFFPSASIGWRLSEENWFSVGAIDNLKLRASYGQLGNDRVGSHQYINSYQLNPGGLVLNGESVGTYSISQLANPNITWETVEKMDIGLELNFLKSFSLEFDYYQDNRSDLLIQREGSLPWVTGIVNEHGGTSIIPDENIGNVENKGIEVQLGYNQQFGDWTVYANANMTYNKSNVIFMDDPVNAISYQQKEGKPLFTDLYYDAIGIFQTQEEIDEKPSLAGNIPGDLIYRDVNEDLEITADDKVRNDLSNVPRTIFGLTGGAAYKGWDFSFLLQGQAQSVQYILEEAGTIGNYTSTWADNRWRPDKPNGTYPRVDTRTSSSINGGLNRNDFWLVNTAFLRIKNVELGYNLPQGALEKIKLKGARVYVNALNLATFSEAKDFDPEGDSESGQFYPQHQIFNIGANIKF